VNANQAEFPVRTMCRVLKVSPSGFYAWRERAPSKRALDDAVLTERIRQIHVASDGNYGSPNIHAEPRDQGTRIGRKRVARLIQPFCAGGHETRRKSIGRTEVVRGIARLEFAWSVDAARSDERSSSNPRLSIGPHGQTLSEEGSLSTFANGRHGSRAGVEARSLNVRYAAASRPAFDGFARPLAATSGRIPDRNQSTQMTGPWGRVDTAPSAGDGVGFFEAAVQTSAAAAGGKRSRNDRYLPTRTSATDPKRPITVRRSGR